MGIPIIYGQWLVFQDSQTLVNWEGTQLPKQQRHLDPVDRKKYQPHKTFQAPKSSLYERPSMHAIQALEKTANTTTHDALAAGWEHSATTELNNPSFLIKESLPHQEEQSLGGPRSAKRGGSGGEKLVKTNIG